MNLIFHSKWVRFGMTIGREADDDDQPVVVSNLGGSFMIADDEVDEIEMPQYDDRFGFAGGT